jgi:uncharacterized protein YjbI with pentapeptide repeats
MSDSNSENRVRAIPIVIALMAGIVLGWIARIDVSGPGIGELPAPSLSAPAGTDATTTPLTTSCLSPGSTTGSDLAGASFEGADQRCSDFSSAHLFRAQFDRALLTDVSFVGAFLREASFVGARLDGADFRQANLAGVDFSRANLRGSHLPCGGATDEKAPDYTGADLSEVRIGDCAIVGGGSVFARASFREVDMKGAVFVFSTLDGSDFTGADLEGVEFTGEDAQPRAPMNVTWSDTICPDGVMSTIDGGCEHHLVPVS